uniref:ParB domain-containing protein n=1 Tax=Panagrellus redivivus TaxID=6233 RepID=A0A7E4VZN5_PANRE
MKLKRSSTGGINFLDDPQNAQVIDVVFHERDSNEPCKTVELDPCSIIITESSEMRIQWVNANNPNSVVQQVIFSSGQNVTLFCNDERHQGTTKQILNMVVGGKVQPFSLSMFATIMSERAATNDSSSDGTILSTEAAEPEESAPPPTKKARNGDSMTTTKKNCIAYRSLAENFIENSKQRTFESRPIAFHLLQHDSTVRPVDHDYVDKLVRLMEAKKWSYQETVFKVTKDGDKFSVLDGNHRLAAMKLFNESTLNTWSDEIPEVHCYVYKCDSPADRIEIGYEPTKEVQQLDLAPYRAAHLIRRYVNSKHIKELPTTREEIRVFKASLEVPFNRHATHSVVHLALLPEETWRQLTQLFGEENVTNPLDLVTNAVWSTFLTALSKNPQPAFAILATLKNKDLATVRKDLGKVEPDLLVKLSGKMTHSWKSDAEAVNFLSNGVRMTPTAMNKVLRKLKFSSMRAPADGSWIKIQSRVTTYLESKKKHIPTLRYVEPTLLSTELTAHTNIFTPKKKPPAPLPPTQDAQGTTRTRKQSNGVFGG